MKLFYRYNFYPNNNPLLAALSTLFARSPACVRGWNSMPQAVWISHQIWSRSVSLWLGPNMGTERFVLALRQKRVCVIFRPMGDARTKAGAVLLKKAEL